MVHNFSIPYRVKDYRGWVCVNCSVVKGECVILVIIFVIGNLDINLRKVFEIGTLNVVLELSLVITSDISFLYFLASFVIVLITFHNDLRFELDNFKIYNIPFFSV